MSTSADEKRAAVRSQLQSLISATAFSFEGRVAWTVEPQFAAFVSGGENAAVDGGIYVGEDPLEQLDGTERTFRIIREYETERVIVPVEIKCPVACLLHTGKMRDRAGYSNGYKFRITKTKRQNIVYAIIVGSVADPTKVAVIPHHILDPEAEGRTEKGYFESGALPLGYANPPPFAMEWSPFVMDLSLLPKAMIEIQRMFFDKDHVMRNPHNEMLFHGLPQPQAYPASVLLPSALTNRLNDHDFIEKLFTSFEAHAGSFRVERLAIKPSTGDCQFVHIGSGTRMLIELKNKMCSVDSISDPQTFSMDAYGQKGGLIFAWNRPWDWLLVGLDTESAGHLARGGFLFFRDDVPMKWFNKFPKSNKLTWTPGDTGFLKRHYVRFTFDVNFASKIEKILLGSSSFTSQRKIPVALIPRQCLSIDTAENEEAEVIDNEEESEPEDNDEDDSAERLPATPASVDGPKFFSRTRFEVMQCAWLMEQCAAAKYGIVYMLGHHPGGRVALAPWVWTRDEQVKYRTTGDLPCQFVDLDPDTPMIYLNFMSINFLDQQTADDEGHTSFVYALKGEPSIFVMDALTLRMISVPHNRFLVPSLSLDIKWRRDMLNAKEVKGNRKKGVDWIRQKLYLHDDRIVDAYAVKEEQVVQKLRGLLERDPEESPISGRCGSMESRDALDIDQFLTFQKDVAQLYLLTLENKTAWFQHGKDS